MDGWHIVRGVTCDFTELLHDFILAFRFRYVAHEKAQIGHADVHFEMLAAFHFLVV